MPQGPFRALRHRDFRTFIAGQSFSMIGTWMQSVAVGWLVFDLTRSAFDVGLVTTLGTLPILLFTLYGGVIADRVDRRRFIIALQSVMALSAIVLAVLTLSGHISVHLVWLIAVVQGTATAFEVPARQAFLMELVPQEEMIHAAALNSTVYNLSRVVGPSLAGIVLAATSPGVCFALNAVSYTGVLVGLLRIRYRAPVREKVERPSVWTGVRFIRSRPMLKALAMTMMLVSLFALSFLAILPVIAREMLGVGAAGYGWLSSSIGLGAAAGAIMLGGFGPRVPRSKVAAIGGITLGAAVLLLATARSLMPAMVLLSIAGASMASVGISTATSLQLSSPSELRGRVMAVYSFMVLGLAPIGAFEAGWLADRIGVPWAIAINGTITLAGVLMLRRRLWHAAEV